MRLGAATIRPKSCLPAFPIVDAHLDGTRAVEDHSGHGRAMLGEGERRETRISMLLGTGRNLRPVQGLCLAAKSPRKLEYFPFIYK